MEKQGSSANKLPVEVDHAKEPLQGRAIGGRSKSQRRRTHACEEEQNQNWRQSGQGIRPGKSSECALLQVDGEAMEAAEVEDVAEMPLVRLQGVRKN